MRKNELGAGIVLRYVNLFIGFLVPVFYTPVMLRLLGQDEYGLYKLAGSLTGFLSLLSFGTDQAAVRWLVRSEDEPRTLGLFLTLFRTVASVTLAFGGGLLLLIDPLFGASLTAAECGRVKLLAALMTAQTAVNFLTVPESAAAAARENFVFTQSAGIFSTAAAPLLSLVLLLCGWSSPGVVLASLAVGIGLRIAYGLRVRRGLGLLPVYRTPEKGELRDIFAFSAWIFVAGVAAQLYASTDSVMIAATPSLGASGVAVYQVGSMITSMTVTLTAGLSALLAPRVNQMIRDGADGAELTGLCVRVGRGQTLLFCLIASGFAVFGRPFLALYAGAGYEQAYFTALWTLLPNAVPMAQSVCLAVIVAQNRHRFRSAVYLGIAVCNAVGTWLLLPRYGIVGAAAVTGIAMLIGQGLAMNWFYARRTELRMAQFWRSVLPLLPVPLILGVFGTILTRFVDFSSPARLLCGILGYTAVYALLTAFFALTAEEKTMLRRAAGRRRGQKR